MAKGAKSGLLILIRDVSIIILITVFLFAAVEVVLRRFYPQGVMTTPGSIEDSELGNMNQPGAEFVAITPEFNVSYRINEDGFRDENKRSDAKAPGVIRLMLLGDSFAFGAGNDYEKIWPVVLEKKLVGSGFNVDVVKAGVSNYDTRTEILYLRRIFEKYKPDVVVIAFLPNDLFTNTPMLSRENTAEKINGAAEKDRSSGRGGFKANVIANITDKGTDSHAVTLAKRMVIENDFLFSLIYSVTARAKYFVPDNPVSRQQIDITKNLFLEARDYCRERGVHFVVLSIPQMFQVVVKARGYGFDGIDVDFIDRVFSEFADENDFIWLPVLEPMVREYSLEWKNLYFRYDGHLNERGNYIAGDYFADKLSGILKIYFNTQGISEGRQRGEAISASPF